MTSVEPPVRWWYARVAPSGGQPGWVIAVASDAYPDGALVHVAAQDAPGVTAGWCAAAAMSGARVIGLRVAESLVPEAPPLWFAEVRESQRTPPATNLLAFSGHGQPAGILHDEGDLTNVSVGTADQVGAVRWYPATGEVDQLFVAAEHRRRGIGTALVHAAGVLGAARGWPILWGDGQRTALGERFRDASYWRHRAAELTHLAPPMTPDAESARRP